MSRDRRRDMAQNITGESMNWKKDYSILPCLLWYRIPVRGEEKSSFPKKDTTAHVLKYMLIILVDSAIVTILLGMEMKAFGIAEVFSKATFMMFLNNLDFCYVLGLPL